MSYQHEDKKIPQRSVLIMLPFKIQIEKLASNTSADFFFNCFLGVYIISIIPVLLLRYFHNPLDIFINQK